MLIVPFFVKMME